MLLCGAVYAVQRSKSVSCAIMRSCMHRGKRPPKEQHRLGAVGAMLDEGKPRRLKENVTELIGESWPTDGVWGPAAMGKLALCEVWILRAGVRRLDTLIRPSR